MNDAWQKKKLVDLLEIQNGFAFDSKAFSSSGNIPLIRIRDLKAGSHPETKYTGEYDQRYLVKAGDLLVGMDGEFGCYEWKGDSALLNQRVCRLQNFQANLVSRFLFYGINSHLKDIEDVTGYTTVKHISSKQILGIEFFIPSFAEQQRIVTILDEAFEAIATARANAEKNLQNARALFDSYLHSIFSRDDKGWRKTTLGNEVDLLVGFAFKSTKYTEAADGISLLRGDNIIQGSLRWDDVKRWSSQDVDHFSRYQLKAGDIVLAMDRPWVKAGLKHASIQEDDLPCLLVQRTACLRNGSALDNRFLMHLIGSGDFTLHILGVQTGIGVPHISGQQIKDFPFLMPSIDQQRLIAIQLDELKEKIHQLEFIYQQKIAALDELKKSLLHQAFSGELTQTFKTAVAIPFSLVKNDMEKMEQYANH